MMTSITNELRYLAPLAVYISMAKVKRTDQVLRVAPVIQKIRADLRRNWTVAQMASAVGVTPSQLRRLFIEAMGEPPKRTLLNIRLEVAAEQLRDPGVRVKEVLHWVGLGDASRFCRAFRRRFGVSPTEFRNRQAQSLVN